MTDHIPTPDARNTWPKRRTSAPSPERARADRIAAIRAAAIRADAKPRAGSGWQKFPHRGGFSVAPEAT